MDYKQLDKHFTASKRISPFYDNTRIPRKLKKKVKSFCWIHWNLLDNGQRLWYYLERVNPNYKRFLIKKVCEENILNMNLTLNGFAMAAKEKLIINRELSCGYCKTAVSRWPFS